MRSKRFLRSSGGMAAAMLLMGCLIHVTASAVTVNVVDSEGTPVSGFRWLVEEDTTYNVVPGVPDSNTLAMRFHASYMPVVAKGHESGSAASIPLPAGKRCFVSVLPDSGHTLSGTNIPAGAGEVTVTVSALPLPAAQITVFVFHDNHPVNNAPDIPAEAGLAGFKVNVIDAGGRYGMSGGQMMYDAFGNMLGTTYDADGNPVSMGNGSFITDANGNVTIRNLAPGKYTMQVIPPAGQSWVQTATIEGTKGIDAWVKANEPPFFVEFGAPGEHVFVGFIQPTNDTTVLSGGGSITGQVVNMHTGRPPQYSFHPSWPFPGAWVGLNELTGGAAGRCIYASRCNDDSTFAIPNVPPGQYQLSIWDDNLDIIFGLLTVTMPANGDLNLGEVAVFDWFFRMEHHVFEDANENGFWDAGENPIPDQAVNLRWRDGTVYQSAPTDIEGAVPFDEIFPFFNWLVAEVDFLRYKATGATFIVDDGGAVLPDQGWEYPSFDVLTPQPQFDTDGVTPLINPNTGNNLSRTETGPVLVQGFQGFLGQTSVVQWGKSNYDAVDIDNEPKGNFPGPEDIDQNGNGLFDASNGGISGIVHYAVTRAENDPRMAAAEPWEPGIPRVQVNLYADADQDTYIDDHDGDQVPTRADVDNYPYQWTRPADFNNYPAPGAPGPEDVDRNGNGLFDFADALNIVYTDSWDDTIPVDCQGPPFVWLGQPTDCYDGLRNFNQIRPAVFDGGYAFTTLTPDSSEGIPEGVYIVEAVPPPGYELVKEEDKNVDFGEEYQPSTSAKAGLLLPPPCVGEERFIPAGTELSLFPGVPCEFANQWRRLPDMKQVTVSRGLNAGCNFFFFTEVPIAGHIVGMILNDLANEFDPNAPTFGEKHAPPWIPISIRDWTGKEITRTYSDQWGTYNALVPSTYTANLPMPSGMGPNMLTVVLNSPGPITDTRPGSQTLGQLITDPYYNPQYSEFSYTFQYMPGTTTYLDTPVLPIAAFVGPGQYPLDCEFPSGTPLVWEVENGPYVDAPGTTIRIRSAGTVQVSNPAYVPGGTEPILIPRDYGFGDTPGTVTIGGVALAEVAWSADTITGTVPGNAQTGQLIITRSNGVVSPMAVTVTVGPISGTVHHVSPNANPAAHPIQDAIDAAEPGDLVLVAPGNYDEIVIMWKPVQLQGYGPLSTIINAVKTPSERLLAWREKVQNLIENGSVDLLPSQEIGFGGVEPLTLFMEEGPGIIVLARSTVPPMGFGPSPNARIDGFSITGADHAGGILVNGYAHYLEISNNKIHGNQGLLGGGIRIGHPTLTLETDAGTDFDSARNDHMRIHHNHITRNGALGGAGGGLSIYTGTDMYEVTDNTICGNFTTGNGAGIGHQGLSRDGLIARNHILFNQSFDQGTNPSGGGIYVGGGVLANAITPGSGSVKIIGNVIQSNQAGAGDGGGIRLEGVNGRDVAQNPDRPEAWHKVDILNNIIAANMTGLAGGGISMTDAARVTIIHNTITQNDSTATSGLAFEPGSPSQSTPQIAGIASHAHTALLKSVIGTAPAVLSYAEFSNPVLANNILWRNRSFYFVLDTAQSPPFVLLPDASTPMFNDLGVLGTEAPRQLNPVNSILTDAAGYDNSNVAADPMFVAEHFNGDRGQTIVMPETTTNLAVAAAFDEGGNFIDVQFGPLTTHDPATGLPYRDYHLQAASPASGVGDLAALSYEASLSNDIDEEFRPDGGLEAGADEYHEPNVVNNAPLAVDDTFKVNGFIINGRWVSAPGFLGNDFDRDGDPLTARIIDGPTNGLLLNNAEGGFLYLSIFFTGSDSFTYVANDGQADSNVATVRLTVMNGLNNAPVAAADEYTMLMDTVLTVPVPGILVNDTDEDGDTLIAELQANVQHGTLTFNSNGSFIYAPSAGFVGTDSFRYRVFDSVTGNSNTVTVTLNVNAPLEEPNYPPQPSATPIDTVMNKQGVTRVVPMDPNFYDSHTFEVTESPVHGAVTLLATGIVLYMPEADYMGADSLTVTVTDLAGATGSVVIPITVTHVMNPMPVVPIQCPPDTDGIDTDGDGIVDNDNVCVRLGAGDGFARMADGRTAYMFGFSDLSGVMPEESFMQGMLAAEFTAPTIAVREGQRLYLNLTNVGMAMRPDLFDPHTVHFHGFPNASSIFDGMPEASIAINMGGTLTYYYELVEPGTFIYHCHAEATEHMQMGMLGNIFVMPKQDGTSYTYKGRTYTKFVYNDGDGSTGYDVGYPIQMGSFDVDFHDASWNVQPLPFALMKDKYAMLNGRGYPDTTNPNALVPPVENGGKPSQKVSSAIRASQGQRILLRLNNLNVTRDYTLACGIPMEVVGHDARLLRSASGENLYYMTNSLLLGSGETADVIVDTGLVGPGTYLLYTTNLNYLSNGTEDFGGMMTEIVVE